MLGQLVHIIGERSYIPHDDRREDGSVACPPATANSSGAAPASPPPPQLTGDIRPLMWRHRDATEGQQLIPTVNNRAA